MASKTFKATAISTSVAIALGSAPPTLAQEDDTIEEVIVTGSHIRRSEYDSRAPIQIVDAEAIELIGAAQPVEVLKALTVNSGSDFYNETNDRAGVSQFNIRNLGLGSTLTLINGKRAGIAAVADQNGTDFVDINQYPLAMISRIEVLTNGASATYGSQAVAGVANIITRKGMEGIEVSGGYSTSQIDAWHVDLAAGSQFDQGGFNVYMTYYEQGNRARTEFDWLDSRLNGDGDQRRSSFLSGTGSPGSVFRAAIDPLTNEATRVPSAVSYPDADCEAAGGVIADPAILNPNTCRYNFADQVSVIAAEERAQVFAEFDWEFSDKVKYYAEASFSQNLILRETGGTLLNTGRADSGGGRVTVLPSHPFNFWVEDATDPSGLSYIGPEAWDPAVNTAATLVFNHRPLGPSVTNTALTEDVRREMDYSRILNGMEFQLPGDWFLDASFMWAKSQRTTTDPSSIRSDTYQDMVRSGAWNPFGTRNSNPNLVSPKDPADTANCFNNILGGCTAGNSVDNQALWNQRSVSTASATETVVDIVASGEIFDIGSNAVAMAVGGQFREYDYRNYPDSLSSAREGGADSVSGKIEGTQDVLAFFAEVVVPMGDIGEIQLAVRNEDYGDGVSTTDPKLGFEFGLGENFGFRGSWGTSFQAPTIRQIGRATSSGFVSDPASATGPNGSFICNDTGVTNNISVVVAGAPDLAPQESENFNLGVVFQSDRFRASVDYFLFDYKDLIAAEAGFQAIVEAQCPGGNNSAPIVPDTRVTRDSTGQVREVRSQFTNIGSVETSGIDFNADYSMDIGNSSLMLDFGATFLMNFDVDSDGDGIKEFDGAGNRNQSNSFNTMPEVRANAAATWFAGNHTARLGINYVDSYKNDQGNDRTIDSWTTVDAMYSYSFSGLIGDGDTTLSVGVNNLLDEDPPGLWQNYDDGTPQQRFQPDGVTYNRNLYNRPGYDDRAGHDIRGQILYVRFKHAF